jgi:acyl-CoA reductase-like NAD-dependent aldehyde dehydrogenase
VNRHLLWIDGQWQDAQQTREVFAPFDSRKVADVAQADAAQMERALAAAHDAFVAYRRSSTYLRGHLLATMAAEVAARRGEFVDSIVHEAGKPRALADAEVSRAVTTLGLGAEEAKRMGGERIAVDFDALSRDYGAAIASWVPRGPVLAIGPFNFPLNLITHKVAPALASGCSVLIKPPPQAPGAATLLGQIFEKAAALVSDAREKVPPGLLQVVHGPNDVVGRAITDPRIATLSFTGSDKVGWMLQGLAIRKKVSLELGGNAAVIVHSDADLDRAAARCAYGAYAYAGQVCISVQRIYVQKSVAPQFEQKLLAQIARLKVGDPTLNEVVVGPLIDSANADRVLAWIDEARKDGARVLCGGTRQGNVITPTLLTGTRPGQRVNQDEIFGPVATLESYETFSEAIIALNHSRFGLQAGVFTDSARLIQQACDEIEAGGIIINEAPTFRADNMPYGGVKDSGLGREGVRYAMEEMSERKVFVHKLVPSVGSSER